MLRMRVRSRLWNRAGIFSPGLCAFGTAAWAMLSRAFSPLMVQDSVWFKTLSWTNLLQSSDCLAVLPPQKQLIG
ncbi:hypothetical protein EF405_19990 [Cyclobacteriaceae bacterium YHN15]|nr:hypothetical protein EF405_19990 [Cyclobacteriaceae bacterium YHN15]